MKKIEINFRQLGLPFNNFSLEQLNEKLEKYSKNCALLYKLILKKDGLTVNCNLDEFRTYVSAQYPNSEFSFSHKVKDFTLDYDGFNDFIVFFNYQQSLN